MYIFFELCFKKGETDISYIKQKIYKKGRKTMKNTTMKLLAITLITTLSLFTLIACDNNETEIQPLPIDINNEISSEPTQEQIPQISEQEIEYVIVPDLVGMTFFEAIDVMNELPLTFDLDFDNFRETSTLSPSEAVILETNPSAGTQVEWHTSIFVTSHTGLKEEIKTADISIDEAEQIIISIMTPFIDELIELEKQHFDNKITIDEVEIKLEVLIDTTLEQLINAFDELINKGLSIKELDIILKENVDTPHNEFFNNIQNSNRTFYLFQRTTYQIISNIRTLIWG